MPHELDKILISSSQPDFEKIVENFRSDMLLAARCAGYGNQENQKVVEILCDVDDRGDEALAEYTKKFDGIKLTPEQFRVSREDLEQAHKQIDPDLLVSLRQAIENVRKYQTEIQ